MTGCSAGDVFDRAKSGISDIINGFGSVSENGTDESAEDGLSLDDWLREHPEEMSPDTEQSSNKDSSSEDEVGEDPSTYAYNHLTSDEKKVYLEVARAIRLMDESVTVSTLDTDTLDKCFNAVIMDHPEFFYIDGYRTTVTTTNDVTVKLDFSGRYTMTEAEKNNRQKLIDAKVSDILENAPMDDNDYEKVKYCFDYIVENTSYDVNSEDNQNICSVFINGSSVCQGYSLAMKYLLDKIDVPCTVVYGTANGNNHAWNLVCVDGTWAYIDATWGDSTYRSYVNKEVVDAINYNYFCCNDDILNLTHHITEPDDLPACTSLEAYYYVKEGLYFTTADKARLKAVFEKMAAGDRDFFMIRADSREVYDELKEILFDGKTVFEWLGAKRVKYADDGTEKTLSFWIDRE
ncbi:MAG: hypothetical protein K6F39_06775 [Lachnospiraceae bacterium]|nr:hypothetical protein [Lachnospiraceae bacterium]